jgi:RNA polymerase sigma-70 factor (ECF subfamily)
VNQSVASGNTHSEADGAGAFGTAEQFTQLYQLHVDMVYRVCYNYLRNAADTEDAVQNVFVKLLNAPREFESAEHTKAWLIRVATNHCKDVLRSGWRARTDLDNSVEPAAPDLPDSTDETLELVLELPETQRICIYLFYYEGYNAAEIGKMLGKPHSTIRNHLSEARKVLKKKLAGGFDE